MVSCDESFYTGLAYHRIDTRKEREKYSINLRQIPTSRKMCTQTRLRTPSRNTTQRLQHPRDTKHTNPRNPRRHHRRQAIQHHAQVVKHVRSEAVALAFGLEGRADTMREEDRCDAAGAVLEDVEKEGGGGRGVGIADSDAFAS